jgi:hypothetical protein
MALRQRYSWNINEGKRLGGTKILDLRRVGTAPPHSLLINQHLCWFYLVRQDEYLAGRLNQLEQLNHMVNARSHAERGNELKL